MRILGVDPGLQNTGYGVVDFGGSRPKILEAGTISPKPKDPLVTRLAVIHAQLGEVIQEYRPEIMVLEKLYSHYRHAMTACLLGHVRGVICLLCAQNSIALVEQSVKRIRKALTGQGGASKLQTQGMVAHALGIDEKQLTPDASDALALTLGYAHMALRGSMKRTVGSEGDSRL